MLNQVIMVGRLVRDPVVEQTENGKSYSQLTLAIPRSFKNADGEYETDFVDSIAWGEIAKNTSEYCRKGDIIGIKGRMQSSTFDDKEGNKKFKLEIVAEKVSFLSSREAHREQDTQER